MFDSHAARGHNEGVNTWDRIKQTGFFPRIVESALRRALGGEEPLAQVLRLDADFDRGSMFRHLTCAVVSPSAFIQVHVDELEDGGAGVSTSIHPLSRLGSIATLEVLADPELGGTLSELTLTVDVQGARRLELEPAHCEDPNCEADHGYSAASFPDDLTMRISAAADGPEALEEAETFVEVLGSVLRRRA